MKQQVAISWEVFFRLLRSQEILTKIMDAVYCFDFECDLCVLC